jgi:lysophospholipid acyltransferase (LPLAT)-like uncharacterized protein
MKKLIKKISRRSVIHSAAARLARGYVRLVLLTSHTHHIIPENTLPYLKGTQPALFASWHNRMLLIPALHTQELHLYAMVSHHSDGRLIGHVLQGFGIGVVYGSTSRGGAHAMRQLISLYEQGNHIALTPDGPRGPCGVVSSGTAQLVLLTNAPLIGLSYGVKRAIRLRSWDHFIIPLPFNRICFTYSEPIVSAVVQDAPKKEQRELLRATIEKTLHEISAAAQQRVSF